MSRINSMFRGLGRAVGSRVRICMLRGQEIFVGVIESRDITFITEMYKDRLWDEVSRDTFRKT